MAGNDVTYEEVFGVSPGGEIQESHGMTWRPCPAVTALRSLLGGFNDVFPPHKLGGRSGYWNEFNRHHAGLAVDIMLSPGDPAQVALGQNLFLCFLQMSSIMQWRGMIYQHVAVNAHGHPGERTEADHMDHLHIDWHGGDPAVTWFSPITTIPFRRRSGTLEQLKPKQGSRIASNISWTAQAQTNFSQSSPLQTALTDLIQRHRQGQLVVTDLLQTAGLAR